MRRSCRRKRPKSHFVEGKIPRIWKMWEDSLEEILLCYPAVPFFLSGTVCWWFLDEEVSQTVEQCGFACCTVVRRTANHNWKDIFIDTFHVDVFGWNIHTLYHWQVWSLCKESPSSIRISKKHFLHSFSGIQEESVNHWQEKDDSGNMLASKLKGRVLHKLQKARVAWLRSQGLQFFRRRVWKLFPFWLLNTIPLVIFELALNQIDHCSSSRCRTFAW